MQERDHRFRDSKEPTFGFGYGGSVGPVKSGAPLVSENETSRDPNLRIDRLKEKKQPSLGELNPMLFPPDFGNQGAIDVLTATITKQIESYGGATPVHFGTRFIRDEKGDHHPRLVARFEVNTLTEEQVRQLEDVAQSIYGKNIRIRKSTTGQQLKPSAYPTIETTSSGRPKIAERNRMLGWYFGRLEPPATNLHKGILVYKDLGGADMANYVHNKKPDDWFFDKVLVDPMTQKPARTKYVVELRESGLYQTDIAMLVTEVSSVLAGRGIIEYDRLFYNTYNTLNRLGTEPVGEADISGLDEQIKRINRALLYPLGNLELSSGIDLKAGSVLLIGYMGTGKTHLVKSFLQGDTGTLLVPVDVSQLALDLAKQPENRQILPRINQVFNKYQIPVVLHIDDVETIAQTDDLINSTLLNLMSGVRDLGFYVIASTNFPEKLSPQLLQPQRFAHVLHLGLPDPETRYGILNIHATKISKGLGLELFESEEERELILRAIAARTESATARVLADVCTEAKTFFEERQVVANVQRHGLTEEDIKGHFALADWQNGLNEAFKKYNRGEVRKRDEELKRFAAQHNRGSVGYVQTEQNQVDLSETIIEMQRLKSAARVRKETFE